ncbi:hypothetical protein BC834DRAFT_105186 [Gloeopeniophorella convolvens]|nr:hypothetical protein BC834DRAFT_105186 [Gloeopeniophorella convolvens]
MMRQRLRSSAQRPGFPHDPCRHVRFARLCAIERIIRRILRASRVQIVGVVSSWSSERAAPSTPQCVFNIRYSCSGQPNTHPEAQQSGKRVSDGMTMSKCSYVQAGTAMDLGTSVRKGSCWAAPMGSLVSPTLSFSARHSATKSVNIYVKR